MRKKRGETKTPIEQQFEQVKNKIAEWENDLKAASQTGPWIMLFIGALVTTAGIFSGRIIVGILGILIIIGAWIWSKRRSKDEENVEGVIFHLKEKLTILEKES